MYLPGKRKLRTPKLVIKPRRPKAVQAQPEPPKPSSYAPPDLSSTPDTTVITVVSVPDEPVVESEPAHKPAPKPASKKSLTPKKKASKSETKKKKKKLKAKKVSKSA